MFKVLFGFFVGAIVMLFILMPGKVSVDNIINPEKRAQAANFENPAQTIETIG